MTRMDNQISVNPSCISTLLFIFIVVLLYISWEISTELNQVSKMITINFIDKKYICRLLSRIEQQKITLES